MNENTMIKQLLAEYGFLAEDADLERNVKDQLTRAQAKDEVDTIAFGLETDDGQIVKVYVNSEHAEKFEQEMAKMLGEVDDIEQALNQISKDIDIIDVEWPEDSDDEGEADEDAEEADDGETDGSEVMDSKVYSKENKKKEQANESYGDELTASLLEGSNNLAQQLQTVNQHLIYQAILHLGVPELALDKSPYRSAILKGIKSTALELAHAPSMRNTLKIFIKQQAMDDKKHGDDESEKEEKPHDEKKPRPHHDVEGKGKKLEPKAPTASSHEEKASKYEVKESDDDVSESSFWNAIDLILKMLDTSDSKELAGKVKDGQPYKSLLARSRSRILGRMTAGVRVKLAALLRELEASSTAKEVAEQYTALDVQALLSLMFRIADDSNGELAARITGSQVFKRLMLSGKTAFISAPSSVRRAFQQLDIELKKVKLTEADDAEEEDLSANDADADKGAVKDEPAAAPTPPKAEPSLDASESGISFEANGDSLKATYPGGAFELSGENLERALKALNNKQTLSIQLDGGKFATVSPRGSSAVIKLMGTDTVIKLSPPDISAFIDAGGQVAEGSPENEPVKEALDDEHERAAEIIRKHADADMDYDELVDLLTDNDIDEELAKKIAKDYGR